MKNLKQRGLSLIELLVALAIGGFLIIGAVTLQTQTRKTFTINEQSARLQETARYVISVIEPEIQLAGLFGFSNNPAGARYTLAGVDKFASDMRVGKPTVSPPAVLDSCGVNYVLDVAQTIQADNGVWSMACAALGGGKSPNTDVLMIRRSGLTSVAASASKFQLYTSRLVSFDQRFFMSNTAPGPIKAGYTEVRDMVFQAFYIAANSDTRTGLPALRLKQLSTDGTQPVWMDQEVIRGVEDIQVEFGVDPGKDDNGDGTPDDAAADGMADTVNGDSRMYVAPDNAYAKSGQIVSVRFWVRVRAEDAEQGFKDSRTYSYAGVTFTPNDQYRRVLMSRTIFLRNSRAFTKS
ncbi:MAG: PilW family protein [Pseudomonadota bacterium]